jgi:hypothetical protein
VASRGGGERPDVNARDRVPVDVARADAAAYELFGGEQAFMQADAGADQRYRVGQIGPVNLRAAEMIFRPPSLRSD